ncbi:Hint domain-containing protein [Psychromarinibacter sp. S121]|uniref:Hint domain-containing protein n=1 Tax=Psychromarinibacter sp. S121 TaxID=3415127 RepID=UPI003C7EB6BF
MFGLGKAASATKTRTLRQETGEGLGADRIKAMPTVVPGMLAGTKVATAKGWCPVETLTEGDLVLTFDRGLQPLRRVTKTRSSTGQNVPQSEWPLFVPKDALGNSQPLMLQPTQPVMIESDAAEVLYGDPFALIDAFVLDGYRGIARLQPEGPVETIGLCFDQDEVVFVNDGALVFCGSVREIAVEDLLSGGLLPGTYRKLDADEALYLVECLETVDAIEDGVLRDPHGGQTFSALFA